ncbi:MAG TPA: ribonuclease P protein component [Draconibacterium sp.]|nr:ribonuclease P protein component [Draconibacterium sp.]HRX10020.1 ribonuclease P protein component [Draconibacterium sp.]
MNNLQENTDNEITDFSFHKNERLCSKKVIDKLFNEGKSVFVYPVKIVYLETSLPGKNRAQAAFSVGKRNFKRAVKRNLIKRRMREAYRLNKQKFYDELDEKQLGIFFIYTGKTISDYKQIEAAIIKGLNKLVIELQ